MVNFPELDRAGAEAGGRVAEEGAQIAREAGLRAESLAVEATPPVWKTIVDTADLNDAAAIVMGSQGLTGLRLMPPGSVSNAVLHHADRPTLVIHRPDDDADHSAGDRGEAADDRAVGDVGEQGGDRGAAAVVAHQEARGLEQRALSAALSGLPMRGWTTGSRMLTSAVAETIPWRSPNSAPSGQPLVSMAAKIA